MAGAITFTAVAVNEHFHGQHLARRGHFAIT
jgi:hypothetical protein